GMLTWWPTSPRRMRRPPAPRAARSNRLESAQIALRRSDFSRRVRLARAFFAHDIAALTHDETIHTVPVVYGWTVPKVSGATRTPPVKTAPMIGIGRPRL